MAVIAPLGVVQEEKALQVITRQVQAATGELLINEKLPKHCNIAAHILRCWRCCHRGVESVLLHDAIDRWGLVALAFAHLHRGVRPVVGRNKRTALRQESRQHNGKNAVVAARLPSNASAEKV